MQHSYELNGVPAQAPYNGDHATFGPMPSDAPHELVHFDFHDDSSLPPGQLGHAAPLQLAPRRDEWDATSNCNRIAVHTHWSPPERQSGFLQSSEINREPLTGPEHATHFFEPPLQEVYESHPSSNPLPGSASTSLAYSQPTVDGGQSTVDGAHGYLAPPGTQTLVSDAPSQRNTLLSDQPLGHMGTADFPSGAQANAGYNSFALGQFAAPAHTFDPAFADPWKLPHVTYRHGKSEAKGALPAVSINIPAQWAVDAKLSRDLADLRGLLEPAFSDSDGKWEGLKWTVRLEFEGYAKATKPQQFNAWSAGRNLPVHSEWTRGNQLRSWPWPRRQPLSKLELAWRVAEELKTYMQTLDRQGTPLMWGPHKICFEDIVIEKIEFCSKGSVQPTLVIYPSIAGSGSIQARAMYKLL
ncbi:hypothetical protein ACG7TL_007848 [Trametes sanguinea]